jgi:short-subunit dehydrogenase
MSTPACVLVTGASSGLGAALALLYAAPGATLHLGGRDPARLAAVADACRARGARAELAAIDVIDREAMEGWLNAADAAAPLDLVIANAGVSAGTGRGEESPEQVRRILAINVDGVLNTVLPAVPLMVGRGHGQIALMSSLAAFRGFPGAPTYCASKAAIKTYGEALRCELKPRGVRVSVVCPGYVDTPMTRENTFPMPFLMTAERAAAIIHRGLARNAARIAFPLPLYAGAWLAGALPPWLADPLLARLPKKV